MNDIQVKVCSNRNRNGDIINYYLYVYRNGVTFHEDAQVANIMGVSEEYYQNLLKTKFKHLVEVFHGEIYISSFDNACIVAEWLQENIMSYILLKELNPDTIIK